MSEPIVYEGQCKMRYGDRTWEYFIEVDGQDVACDLERVHEISGKRVRITVEVLES